MNNYDRRLAELTELVRTAIVGNSPDRSEKNGTTVPVATLGAVLAKMSLESIHKTLSIYHIVV